VPAAVETLVNVLFALLPKAVTDAMQTTMIKANITAYSTAVGPSSRFKKSDTEAEKLSNMEPSPRYIQNSIEN